MLARPNQVTPAVRPGAPAAAPAAPAALSIEDATSKIKDTTNAVLKGENYGTFREGIMYLLFLITFLLITLNGPTGGTMPYYYTDRMKELFVGAEFRQQDVPNWAKTFNDILTPEDVWYFLEGPMLSGLFQHQWYNGLEYSEEEKGMILLYNRLLGGARIRQLRVQPGSCEVRDQYKSIIKYCYGDFSERYEDTAGFGPVMNAAKIADGTAWHAARQTYELSSNSSVSLDLSNVCNHDCKVSCLEQFKLEPKKYDYTSICQQSCAQSCTCLDAYKGNATLVESLCQNPLGANPVPDRMHKYRWQSAEQLDELPFWGWVQVYPGSGFIQDLPINGSEAREIILQMKEEKFIDLGTRIVFVDFTVYNAYLGLYNVVRFSMEFPASGGVIPKAVYRAVQIERYDGGFSLLVALEACLLVFVLFYFMQEMMEIASEGLGYFRHLWNFLDISNLVVFLVVICLRLYTCDMVYGILGVTEQLPELRATTYPNLQKVAFLITQETNLNAINAWIMWFKVFKYCQVSKRMSFLLRIMARASTDIFFFSLMFLVFFLGFAQAGYLAFSADIADFRSFDYSILTCFRAVVGDLDYEELYEANNVFGPMFYILYYITVLLVLVNVFLAILNDAYSRVREEDQASGEDQARGPLSGGVSAIFNSIRGKPLTNKALTAALDASVSDDSCNLEELKAVLRKAKLSNPDEIAIQLMNEFDVNGDQTLDAEEMKMVKKRLQELESAEARQGGRGGGGNPSFGGAITDADMQLLDGFTSLEDRVQELSRMNDARHVQMTRIEEMLGSLR